MSCWDREIKFFIQIFMSCWDRKIKIFMHVQSRPGQARPSQVEPDQTRLDPSSPRPQATPSRAKPENLDAKLCTENFRENLTKNRARATAITVGTYSMPDDP